MQGDNTRKRRQIRLPAADSRYLITFFPITGKLATGNTCNDGGTFSAPVLSNDHDVTEFKGVEGVAATAKSNWPAGHVTSAKGGRCFRPSLYFCAKILLKVKGKRRECLPRGGFIT